MKKVQLCFLLSLMFTATAISQPSKQKWIKSKIEAMTLRQQIAQLFVVDCYPSRGEKYLADLAKQIHDEQIGGIIWGECPAKQCVETLNFLQTQVNIPLLVTIDAEWGVSMRIDSVIPFPKQLTLGAISNNELIYEMGKEVARQCKLLGIHFNFAPVVDVNCNPDNPVINMRSFGENKYKVTEKAYQYMRGMQDCGLLTCLKHFPGHGDTDKDSHKEMPIINHSFARIDSVELYPFRELVKRGAKGVMTGHLRIPALDADVSYASSQSKKIVTDLLQKKMKFKGLVVTDGMGMRAAVYNQDPNKVALNSLIAGNDILELPRNLKKSIDEIENAVANGLISKRYIRKKCRKILAAKYDLGLYKGFEPISSDKILEKLNTKDAELLRQKLASAAITIIKNENVLPLKSTSVTYIEIGKTQGGEFEKELKNNCNFSKISIDAKPSKEQIDSIKMNLHCEEFVVVGYHSTQPKPQSNYGVDSTALNFIDGIAKTQKIILVYFGNPYALAKFANLETYAAIVVAYDNTDFAQRAAARVIAGKANVDGRLPVSINEKYKENFGINLN